MWSYHAWEHLSVATWVFVVRLYFVSPPSNIDSFLLDSFWMHACTSLNKIVTLTINIVVSSVCCSFKSPVFVVKSSSFVLFFAKVMQPLNFRSYHRNMFFPQHVMKSNFLSITEQRLRPSVRMEESNQTDHPVIGIRLSQRTLGLKLRRSNNVALTLTWRSLHFLFLCLTFSAYLHLAEGTCEGMAHYSLLARDWAIKMHRLFVMF